MKNRFFATLSLLIMTLGAIAAEAPKYIFYFIGDGMGWGQVNTTQQYLRDVVKEDSVLTMLRFPVVSTAITYSASNDITDSTAAGTALATGVKTRNGMMGMTTDSVPVVSVAEQLRDMGYGIGIVTSVAPDDATPGAFYAKAPSRNRYYEIGSQAAMSGFDFIGGANWRGLKDKSGNPTDLWNLFEQNGVQTAYGLDTLATLTSPRVVLLGTNRPHDSGIGYAIDSVAGALRLQDMTRACLNHLLKQKPERFFMMVEGGAIDHACHANDAATAIGDVLAFDESLAIAYDFYLRHPDETLILVTADHETGGMAIGNTAHGYTADLKYLPYQRVSKDRFNERLQAMLRSRRAYRWEDMREMLANDFGFWRAVPVTEEETARLENLFNDTFANTATPDQKTMYANFKAFAVETFRILDTHTGMGWTTVHHTANPVPVMAVGVGSELFSGMNDNIDLPAKLRKIAKIDK